VLEAVYAILGDKYMWGSDNPFMSWCDDRLRIVYTYEQEMEVVNALPARLARACCPTAPHALAARQGEMQTTQRPRSSSISRP
jgi:hypothetical protein